MSIEDVAKSLLTEAAGPDEKQPAAGVEDGSMEAEKQKVTATKPDPKPVDPNEVQYPSCLKDGGSL